MQNNNSSSHNFIESIGEENRSGVRWFIKTAELSKTLARSGAKGHCGYSALLIFLYIFILKFINQNIYRGIVLNENCKVSKDAVYDFLKSANINWRKFLITVSLKIHNSIYRNNNIDNDSVIIIDDTTFKKERSKKLELRSKAYDHVNHCYYKGYKMLNILWSDEVTSLPLDFMLMSSPNAKNRCLEATKQLDCRTNGAKRREEAIKHAPDNVIESLKRIFLTPFKSVKAIVCDSWFAQAPLVIRMTKYAPVITMLKKSTAKSYEFKGKLMSISEIYRSIKSIRKGKNIIANIIINLVDKSGNKIPARVIFIRHKITGDWIPILSTSTEYTSKKIIHLYKMRWDIEVFHKDIKSHLDLENGSQSTDYDAIIAYTTIILTRYIFLSYKKRMSNDPRAMGGLLYYMVEELKKITFEESLKRIFNVFSLKLNLSADKQNYSREEIVVAMMEAIEQSLYNGILSVLQAVTQKPLELTPLKAATAGGL